MKNTMKKTFNWRETCKEKFKKYFELQDEARKETDIDKRNKLLSELRKININLAALKIIFEEELTEEKSLINKAKKLINTIKETTN